MSKERVEQVINQGIHRFLADGVIYRDLMDIRAAMPDWSQWRAVWPRIATTPRTIATSPASPPGCP